MKPIVVWITGLSSAGKTTTANALFEKCKDQYRSGLVDGDVIRARYDKPIGFDMKSRERMVNEAIYSTKNIICFQKADLVIVAMISPLRSMRDSARDILTKYCDANFIEVFMDTPIEICEERDPKGLYKKARAGEIKDFTGIDSPYESPINPEVWLPVKSPYWGKELTVEKAADIIYNQIHNTTTL
jgi:adenylyl-sulfate kinase